MLSTIANYISGWHPSQSSPGKQHLTVNLPSIETHEIETDSDRRGRRLKHLLRLNHATHAVLYHHLHFHNHTAHILGSSYLLGADVDQLNAIYDKEAEVLEPWEDSPEEISRSDWRYYLGDPQYQRAFVDFFEDQLVRQRYDWKKVVEEYLFSGDEPLINCLVAGLGHPLIHLGYAYELSIKEVAIEALTMASASYNYLHKYMDDSSYTRPSPINSTSPLHLLKTIAIDPRFNDLYTSPGGSNLNDLFENHEHLILEYWNAWQIGDPTSQFAESQKAAAAVLVASNRSHDKSSSYDFFLVHLLTTSHAIRILFPIIPPKYHISMIRQWWLITVAIYVSQLRPAIDLNTVADFDLNGRDWDFAVAKATKADNPWSMDAHFVKAVRAMKEAAKTWGDDDRFYLKAAVKFSVEFDGWGGFGANDIEEHEVRREKI
ncbi:MAG: hypothetical protein M1834_004943 [Cirrosporium novae-zelandiae]|nr:MAG: hypothetical protein M1834_004943 [Cirrosporium novae-zelandiae]